VTSFPIEYDFLKVKDLPFDPICQIDGAFSILKYGNRVINLPSLCPLNSSSPEMVLEVFLIIFFSFLFPYHIFSNSSIVLVEK